MQEHLGRWRVSLDRASARLEEEEEEERRAEEERKELEVREEQARLEREGQERREREALEHSRWYSQELEERARAAMESREGTPSAVANDPESQNWAQPPTPPRFSPASRPTSSNVTVEIVRPPPTLEGAMRKMEKDRQAKGLRKMVSDSFLDAFVPLTEGVL